MLARVISSSEGCVSLSNTPDTVASSNDNPAIEGESSSCDTTDPAVTKASASSLDAAVTIRTMSFPTSEMILKALTTF